MNNKSNYLIIDDQNDNKSLANSEKEFEEMSTEIHQKELKSNDAVVQYRRLTAKQGLKRRNKL